MPISCDTGAATSAIEDAATILQRTLRQHGLKFTPQRFAVVASLSETTGHVTADQLLLRVQRQCPSIPPSTVYRTLAMLKQVGLASAMAMGTGRLAYEWIGTTPHHHLICRCCGRSEQVEQQALDAMLGALTQTLRFHVEFNHAALFGVCAACVPPARDSEQHARRNTDDAAS